MTSYIKQLIHEWSYKSNFLSPLQWKLIDTEKIIQMAFHTGAIINEFLYIHGGSSNSQQFSAPINNFFRFHLQRYLWENLSNYPNSPSLSNHASTVIDKRYFVMIGGWNGERCESNIYMFDTVTMQWRTAVSKGLPEEMDGLACHTANIIKPTETNSEILILASNSKVRKNHTLAFKLQPNDDFTLWTFTKLPNRIYFQLDHACVSINKNILHCIGGNFTKLLQKIHVSNVAQDPKNLLVSTLITHVEDNKFNNVSAISWNKEVCRGHSTISGKNGFLFLNGIKYHSSETEFTKNMFIYLNLGTKKGLYYVGDTIEQMAYGVCATDPCDGNTYYHGGLRNKNDNQSRIYQLNFAY